MFIQYIGIYPLYLEVLSSICNPRTLHAMVTGTHITWTDEYQHSKMFRVWSCCCCETMMKLNNMLTLGYALFVLHAPNSVGTYQAVKSNNAVSHPGRPESPATPLSEPHSWYRLSYMQNTQTVKCVCRLVRWSMWCSAEHLDMAGSDRRADILHNTGIHNLYSSPHISWWDVWKM